jgi:ribokinase
MCGQPSVRLVLSICTQRKGGVVVVGSANTDLFAYVKRLPLRGETIHGHGSSIGCGGKASNQAVAAARLAASVAMVAKLGEDAFGDAFMQAYRTEGIDTRCVQADALLWPHPMVA